MKLPGIFLISLCLCFCTPKGPQTFNSPFLGKTKKDLIAAKGIAKEIKVFDNAEAYIYKTREEFFGKKVVPDKNGNPPVPKRVYIVEYIYYINKDGMVYKYQVWKKRID